MKQHTRKGLKGQVLESLIKTFPKYELVENKNFLEVKGMTNEQHQNLQNNIKAAPALNIGLNEVITKQQTAPQENQKYSQSYFSNSQMKIQLNLPSSQKIKFKYYDVTQAPPITSFCLLDYIQARIKKLQKYGSRIDQLSQDELKIEKECINKFRPIIQQTQQEQSPFIIVKRKKEKQRSRRFRLAILRKIKQNIIKRNKANTKIPSFNDKAKSKSSKKIKKLNVATDIVQQRQKQSSQIIKLNDKAKSKFNNSIQLVWEWGLNRSLFHKKIKNKLNNLMERKIITM